MHPELYVEKLSDEWMLPLCSPRLLEGEQPVALAARSAALPPDPDRSAGDGADLGRLAAARSGIDGHRHLARPAPQRRRPRARCGERGDGRGAGLQAGRLARHRSGTPGRRRSGRSCRCPGAPTISCAPRGRRSGPRSRRSATGCSRRSRTPSPSCGCDAPRGGEARGRVVGRRAGALGKRQSAPSEAREGGDDVRTLRIAAIPGDGIGKEVIAAGVEVLDACARRDGGFAVAFDHFDWGSERYKKTGAFMPDERPRPDQGPRRHPVRLGRRARRARPHHAVGPAARHLPAVRPVRQRAPDAHPAGHHQPAARRHRARSSTG